MPLKADELNWTELTCTAPSWPSYTTRYWPRASRHEVDWLHNRAAVRELRFENWNSVQSSSVICCEHALTLSQSADGELWKGQMSGWMGANVGTRGAWAAAGNSLCTCGVRYCVVRHWLTTSDCTQTSRHHAPTARRFVHLLWCPKGRSAYRTSRLSA